ncbi:TonB-dependent receptor [Pseudoduganella sp. FT93W]|uniref:TonB-dependent receptor n=1 Tax=Duganella fentianensis TaxID=2692177 RepID=A0A845HXM2_9BURK|nr:TonB-dependent receptor [Duganella fentianensis]MYN45612.1 TonB-dependent receptor [Duganella fentianensis]
MKQLTRSPLALAVAMALGQYCSGALAQQSNAGSAAVLATAAEAEVEQVVVTGVRSSREKSLVRKRGADSVMDVVSAEDIGKLPDKNVADAVQRVAGVNISSGSGGQGGFSENDRVSIRGTNPSLTQTTVNGHSIATGDWYVGDQTGTVGRSVSFTLLPSEIVGSVEVLKSAQADITEGGTTGNVNIVTRKPLDFKQLLTLEATAQAMYADLPRKTSPQANALLNWRNEEKTLGVLAQVFSESRKERRDGQELFLLGQGTITHPDVIAAHPDLKDVLYPSQIGSALFTQQSKRQGGLLDVQVKPVKTLTLEANAFYSHFQGTNYDTNYLANPTDLLEKGIAPTSYTVRNNTLVAATFPVTHFDPSGASPGGDQPFPGLRDVIYRPKAASMASYLDLSAKYRPTDRLQITGMLGYTRGLGETPHDYGYEAYLTNSAMSYQMHGTSGPASVSFPGVDAANFNNPANVTNGGSWSSSARVTDQERYAQIDALADTDWGHLESVKFGVRFAAHKREADGHNFGCSTDSEAACLGNPGVTLPLPQWNGETTPANYGSSLGGGSGFLSRVWTLDPAKVALWHSQYNNVDLGPNYQGNFAIEEKVSAAYAMANLAGDGWRGNVGLRVAGTRQRSLGYNFDADNHAVAETVSHNYVDVLPSANLRFDVSKDLVARLAASKTMSRPDYSALTPAVTLNNINATGTGGNTDLKPVRSYNADATLEWYYAPQSVLSAAVFYMDMPSYIAFGYSKRRYLNTAINQFDDFTITTPLNVAAKNKGIELAWQQPLWQDFGAALNYTYAHGRTADGASLVGSSANTYNAEVYYEKAGFSTRLAYSYRSAYLVGLANVAPQYAAGMGTLAISVNYKLNDHITFTLDALNLNNPTLKYYSTADRPQAFYSNGRQLFFGVKIAR